MKIESDHIRDEQLVIMHASGRIQMQDGDLFEQELGSVDSKAASRFVLDLAKCDFICSTALGAIIATKRRLMRQGIEMRLVVDRGDVLDVIRLTMIDRIVHVEPTVAAALESFPRLQDHGS
ncbi:MAG: STAS domain-containing protein [Leptospiraceae bacterium]|nr:STAS domain-containing protein [Leptospiraceae bacterium]